MRLSVETRPMCRDLIIVDGDVVNFLPPYGAAVVV